MHESVTSLQPSLPDASHRAFYTVRLVPLKTEEQQSRLMVHRARQGHVVARTATVNRIRSLLSEFGIVLPRKAEVVRRERRAIPTCAVSWYSGARAVLNASATRTDSVRRWATKLVERQGYWKAIVAIAAKNARLAWAVLTKGEAFKVPA